MRTGMMPCCNSLLITFLGTSLVSLPYKDMQIDTRILKSSSCPGKPQHVKLLRGAVLSLFCFCCLLSTWKSDATKLNPIGGKVLHTVLWLHSPSCQQTISVQEYQSSFICQTHAHQLISTKVLFLNKSIFVRESKGNKDALV